MVVGFNTTPLNSGHKGRGMGFYTQNLLSELKKIDGLTIKEFTDLRTVKNVDLVHYPYFDLFNISLPLGKIFPTVVTVPDITPLLFSKYYPPGVKGWIKNKLQLYALRNVKKIITLSEASKKDIADFLKISSERINSIYLSYNPQYRVIKDSKLLEEIKRKYNLPDRFALFIGNPNWNKNIENIAESCVRAGLDVLFVGKGFENTNKVRHPELQSYNNFLDKYLGNPLVHLLGFVLTEDLVYICNLSSVLLLPSFYEGFGMTILEGQACGTPVITSKTSSMPEVAGKGAILVEPDDIEGITNAVKRIIKYEKFKEVLIKDGFENVKRFSWKKTAEETFEVYKEALNR